MGARSGDPLLAALFALLLVLPACSGTEPPASGRADAPAIDTAEVERLRALGYVNVAPALPPGARVGVLAHDAARSASGLNLLTNAKFCSTQLIDMEARVLRSWSHEPCFRWGNAVLTRSGDLLVGGRLPHDPTPRAAIDARYLMRMDWDGDVVWSKRMPVHHDVEQTPDGRILTLTYSFRILPEVDPEVPVRDNAIVLLDAAG
jgi:hypothetical protein